MLLCVSLLCAGVAWAGSRDEAKSYAIDDLTLFGIARQGGWLKGKIAKTDKLKFLNYDVSLDAEGGFILGLPYDAPEQLFLMRKNQEGKSKQYVITIAQRDYPIQRIDGLDPKKVTAPESEWGRIKREAKSVRVARDVVSDYQGFNSQFIWPVRGRISGKYGVKRILNGQERSPHYGIDIAAVTGTPVRAPAAGRVVLVHPGMYFSGKTLILDHGHGLFSSFLHLNKIYVPHGKWVKQGEKIGTVGKTGRATGPHLDWRINWHKERLDAELFLPPQK